MDQLIELLQQIQELAGVAIDALSQVGEGGGPPEAGGAEGGPAPEGGPGGAPAPEGAPPGGGAPGGPPPEEPPA